MRYTDRSLYVTLARTISHIAAVATSGDRKAAIEDLVAAAADGAIEGFSASTHREFIDSMTAWPWQCVRRGEGHIGDDEKEIVIKVSPDWLTKEPRTIRFYDIWFARADVAQLWQRPKPKPQAAAANGRAAAAPLPETPLAPPQPATTPSAARRPRAAYRNELRSYLAPRDIATLVRQGKDAIAAEFMEHCRKTKPTVATTLPKPREVANQVQRILDSRRAKPQTSSASNRPEPPSSPSNRI